MLFKNTPEKFWNLIASKYAASPISDRTAYETKIQKIKSHLTNESRVLDIGCATGTQCGGIAGEVKQVTGIDISSKLLTIAEQRMAERKLGNIEFFQTTVFDERFKSGSFDVVTAFYVLHFFEDIDSVFNRIHDLLKPGGLFISETACLGERNIVMARLLRFAGQLGFLPLTNLLTTQKLEHALDKAGFTIIDKTKFSKSSYAEFTLFARKPE
ncbi:MAG: class I SAM-dependent methyltransferase [Gammaproteobacteria bacterium]|nr:class I SAM-dependent methyltransferase [Gammaproteobacteria bacterium]